MGIASLLVKVLCALAVIVFVVVVLLTLWLTSHDPVIMLQHSTTTEMEVVLLVLIHASAKPEGRDRRNTIRRTWVSPAILDDIEQEFQRKVTYKFVLGGKGLRENKEARDLLVPEIAENEDMIILEQVTDAHETLTQRTLQGLEYIIEENFEFSYLLKCDDDTFVDLKSIMKSLKDLKWRDRLYWGHFVGGYDILEEGLYAEHSWFLCDKYIPYAFGGGYVLSRDLVELIQRNAPFLTHYMNEDVSLASWLSPYNIVRVHDQSFDTGSESKGCMKAFNVAHKISIKDMRRYYKSLRREGRMCGRRTRTRGVVWERHLYDWSKPPTQCCCKPD